MLYSFDVIDFLDRGRGNRRISIVNWIALSLFLVVRAKKKGALFVARANTAITSKLTMFRVLRNVDNDDDGKSNELMKFIRPSSRARKAILYRVRY